ncbi:hypothetical protein EDB80DRAFT_675256 [Ilyonectria destructans]|nr:hypothetical protein EDB80DRAFT_675256 [Ilyonectria destructans]
MTDNYYQGGSGGTPQLTTHLAERTCVNRWRPSSRRFAALGGWTWDNPSPWAQPPRASRAGHATKPIGMLPFWGRIYYQHAQTPRDKVEEETWNGLGTGPVAAREPASTPWKHNGNMHDGWQNENVGPGYMQMAQIMYDSGRRISGFSVPACAARKPGSLAEAHVASAAISRGPVQRCTTQPSGISARSFGFHQARADSIRQSSPNKIVGRGPERAISCPDGCEEGRPDQIRSGRWAVCKAWQGRVNW